MHHSIADLAELLGVPASGDASVRISGLAEPGQAGPHDLAIAMSARYAETLRDGAAQAALMWDGADWQAFGLTAALCVPRPRYALAALSQMFDPGPGFGPGVHPTAAIDPAAVVPGDAQIGAFTVIGPEARIGAGARIGAHVTIGRGASLGTDALLHDGVRIAARVNIGDRFIAQPGAIVGGDGFSFVTPDTARVEAVRETLGAAGATGRSDWTRIHSLGGVVIGDDVEIGAATTIDAGTIRATSVGRGTKIDNGVQVGHNVRIGENALICAHSAIGGSTVIGDRVVLGGKTAVSDNVFVGDDVVAGGGTVILSNVPAGRAVFGYPAMRMPAQIEAFKNVRRLPRLFAAVEELQKQLRRLTRPE